MGYAKALADRLPGLFCLYWSLGRTFLKNIWESGFWLEARVRVLTGFVELY
jgi:hypothetical protein